MNFTPANGLKISWQKLKGKYPNIFHLINGLNLTKEKLIYLPAYQKSQSWPFQKISAGLAVLISLQIKKLYYYFQFNASLKTVLSINFTAY